MRNLKLVLAFLFVAAASCGVEAPPAGPTSSANTSAAAGVETEALVCPDICGEDTLCQLPTGVCRAACNPCLCEQAGGKVVAACPGGAAPQAAADGQ